MARKFGRKNKMSMKFEDYSYIINGVGSIGKTTLAYEIGRYITGSDEGTFIITCGGENEPKHIDGAFGDVAKDFKTFMLIVKELCENKNEYPNTRFVAIDSLDEYARICENYVISEWNSTCDINERAKSISQAYKGFQKGENRACDLMIQQIMKLQAAGYSLIEIGHTKVKSTEDPVQKIKFDQISCNLDNKYYNALKDKVNLVGIAYWENVIDNVEEKKNAFNKKMEKVGELRDRKRVMAFADDSNVIDTKTHFDYITHKIDLSAENFVKAVEDAIKAKLEAVNDAHGAFIHKAPSFENEYINVAIAIGDSSNSSEDNNEEYSNNKDTDSNFEEDEVPFNTDTGEDIDIFNDNNENNDEPVIDKADIIKRIRAAFKTADSGTKDMVKSILSDNGANKLSESLSSDALLKIANVLGC